MEQNEIGSEASLLRQTPLENGDVESKTDKAPHAAEDLYPILVHYFYFPKDGIKEIKGFCELFATNFEVIKTASDSNHIQLSGFSQNDGVLLYTLKKEELHIELVLLSLRQHMCLAAFWLHKPEDPGETKIWRMSIDELSELKTRLKEKDFSILGETRFFVIYEPQQEQEFSAAKEMIDKREMLISDIDGGRLFHFPDRRLRVDRNYILKFDKKTAIKTVPKLYYQHLPTLDFTIHRSNRLTSLYRDELATVMSEKKETDSQINQVLHQQVVVPQEDEKKLALWESEIANLSRMYGRLAADAAKIREAMSNTYADLENIRRELKSITGKSVIGSDQIFQHYIELYKEVHDELVSKEREIQLSVDRVKAAIDLVQTQVELFRGAENVVLQAQTKELLGQNIKLQEERMALQVAAGFVEFVIIFYYFLNSWAEIYGLHEFELLPWYAKFGVSIFFSGSVVLSTHFIAQMVQKRSFKSIGFWVSLFLLLAAFASAVFVGYIFSTPTEITH